MVPVERPGSESPDLVKGGDFDLDVAAMLINPSGDFHRLVNELRDIGDGKLARVVLFEEDEGEGIPVVLGKVEINDGVGSIFREIDRGAANGDFLADACAQTVEILGSHDPCGCWGGSGGECGRSCRGRRGGGGSGNGGNRSGTGWGRSRSNWLWSWGGGRKGDGRFCSGGRGFFGAEEEEKTTADNDGRCSTDADPHADGGAFSGSGGVRRSGSRRDGACGFDGTSLASEPIVEAFQGFVGVVGTIGRVALNELMNPTDDPGIDIGADIAEGRG